MLAERVQQSGAIPVVQEDAIVSKPLVETEQVRVRTSVEEVPVVMRDALSHEHVEIKRLKIEREIERAPAIREEDGVTITIKHSFLPDEHRHTYEEGVRRGGALLTADVDNDRVDEAVSVLEGAGSIDVDDRTSQWRSSGWHYPAGGSAAPSGLGGAQGARTDTPQTITSDSETSDEQIIPVVKEQLVVGKRDVNRGSARVRSFVTETPVHEQIRLREERINVERRSVDQPLSEADSDPFRERTIEMTATSEEAVVGKSARVAEEVVVANTAEERVEDVNDTVRRIDVDIDRDADRDLGTQAATIRHSQPTSGSRSGRN